MDEALTQAVSQALIQISPAVVPALSPKQARLSRDLASLKAASAIAMLFASSIAFAIVVKSKPVSAAAVAIGFATETVEEGVVAGTATAETATKKRAAVAMNCMLAVVGGELVGVGGFVRRRKIDWKGKKVK